MENEIQIEENQDQGQEFKPLFEEEESFTEAQLTGIEEETPPEEKKDDGKATQEQATEKESEGYVPHAALHETRELLKEEKAARKDLEDKVDQLAAEKAEPEMPDGFKVLTDEELDELIEDDPQEALRYQFKFKAYNEKKAKAEEAMENQQRQAENFVMNTVDRIEKAVPGLYDEDNSIGKDLADFAIKSGFKDEAFLEVMTNPATVVIPAGSKTPYLLSNGAASLIEMLHNLHKGKGASSSQEGSGGKISTGGPVDTKELTEAEFAGLSEAERKKLLGG